MSTLSHDQLLMLTVAAYGPPQMRCEFAEKYGATPSMIGLIHDQLVELVPAIPGMRAMLINTPRGRILLNAMIALPLPERVNEWQMPKTGGTFEC